MIFKKLNHIGIVVENLQKTMADMSGFLGLECDEEMILEEIGVRIAFYSFEGGQMEFIQFQGPIEGVDPFVTQPKPGVQHIAFSVEDIDSTITELKGRGMKLINGFPRKGAHGMVAFFYPIEGLDLLIEICQDESFLGKLIHD